jgi:vitamin B12 transporter
MKAAYTHIWPSAETQFFYTKTLHHRTLNVRSDVANLAASSITSKGDIDTLALNHTQYTNDFLTQNFNFEYQHEEDQLNNFNENLSLFLYNRLEKGPGVINFGARLDSNKYFGEHVTYKVALMHVFSFHSLKLSYSTGFRAPSLNQLYDPIYGNKNLNPEESQTAELGLEIPISDHYKYLGSVFATDLYNRLTYDPNTFVNQNRGRALNIGFENTFDAKINKDLTTALSATWLSARDMTAKQKLARRPNFSSKISLSYKKEKHSATVDGNYTGKRPDVDNSGNTVLMPSYTIFNLNYAFDFNQSFSTYLKIKNILNKDYEEVFGYGTGGRAFTLGLKYVF